MDAEIELKEKKLIERYGKENTSGCLIEYMKERKVSHLKKKPAVILFWGIVNFWQIQRRQR